MIYEDNTLKRILVDGGYIEDGRYHFYVQDHLGNNRMVVDQEGTVAQITHYYPFGMSFAESTEASKQPYKYNGKELDMENSLNTYDYEARLLSVAVPRFTTMDPHAERYYSISPYVYTANNPLRYIDPTGKDYWSTNDPEEIRNFINILKLNPNRNTFQDFNYSSWDHATDAEFTGNLTYNDETKTFYSSYGTVENGEFVSVGISIKAFGEYEGYAYIPNYSAINWLKKSSGVLNQVNIEFGGFNGNIIFGTGFDKKPMEGFQ